MANTRFHFFKSPIAGFPDIYLCLTVNVAEVSENSENEAGAHEQVIQESVDPPKLGEHAKGLQRSNGREVSYEHACCEQ